MVEAGRKSFSLHLCGVLWPFVFYFLFIVSTSVIFFHLFMRFVVFLLLEFEILNNH